MVSCVNCNHPCHCDNDETCDKCDCAYCEHSNPLDEFWKNLKDGTHIQK